VATLLLLGGAAGSFTYLYVNPPRARAPDDWWPEWEQFKTDLATDLERLEAACRHENP